VSPTGATEAAQRTRTSRPPEKHRHRAIGRKTPAVAFVAREKAVPRAPIIDSAGFRVRHDKVDGSGTVTLRYRRQLHHIGVGRPYSGWRVVLLVAGKEVRIVGLDLSPLQHLVSDRTKDYQAIP
jgi:hypothetical protein